MTYVLRWRHVTPYPEYAVPIFRMTIMVMVIEVRLCITVSPILYDRIIWLPRVDCTSLHVLYCTTVSSGYRGSTVYHSIFYTVRPCHLVIRVRLYITPCSILYDRIIPAVPTPLPSDSPFILLSLLPLCSTVPLASSLVILLSPVGCANCALSVMHANPPCSLTAHCFLCTMLSHRTLFPLHALPSLTQVSVFSSCALCSLPMSSLLPVSLGIPNALSSVLCTLVCIVHLTPCIEARTRSYQGREYYLVLNGTKVRLRSIETARTECAPSSKMYRMYILLLPLLFL